MPFLHRTRLLVNELLLPFGLAITRIEKQPTKGFRNTLTIPVGRYSIRVPSQSSLLRLYGPVADHQQALGREQITQIPVVSLDDLLGNRKCEIRLRVMKYEDGMTPHHDSLALLSVLVAENPSEVLEIGTYMGHTARAMAENLETATIHTIDLPPDFSDEQGNGGVLPKNDFHLIARRDVGREFKGQPCGSRIVQHIGDTAVMDFTRIGRPTFFFIDGSHTYEYCKNDSEKCLSLCPKGGTFLWHDCYEGHPGVIKLLSEWRAQGRNIVRVQGTGLAYWKSH